MSIFLRVLTGFYFSNSDVRRVMMLARQLIAGEFFRPAPGHLRRFLGERKLLGFGGKPKIRS